MQFDEPGWLTLLALAPLPWLRERARPRLAWPSLGPFKTAPRGALWWFRGLPALLRVLAIVALAIALARPRTVAGRTRLASRGVAIVAALDHSSTMNTKDFPTAAGAVSRLEAAKDTFIRFVEGRPDDLIGLVAFANYADLTCPATLDHAFLIDAAGRLKPVRPGDDGTNLGDAIAWALEALRRSPPRKKVLILLTDGRNSPAVEKPADPKAAAKLVPLLGAALHTIAVGKVSPGAQGEEPEGPDLVGLAELARIGGGRSFVAADANDLDRIFREIDALERSPIRATILTRYRDWRAPWIAGAAALLAVDRLLAAGRLRRLP